MNKKHLSKTALLKHSVILLCLATANVAIAETAEPQEIDPRVLESRKAIKEFGGKLMKELKQAMEEGGPEKAIKVCNIEAPDIAKGLSKKYDWKIGRTSLKTRNSDNNPDEWEFAVLQQFEQRKRNGEDVKKLEYFEIIEEGDVQEAQVSGEDRTSGQTFRYMKAIPTKGLCLACHGEKIQEPLKATLTELYPQDRATGFKTGDIRGAFTIIQK